MLCHAVWLLVLLQAGDAGGPLCRSFTILGALCTDGNGSNSTNSTGSSLGGCEAWDALCLPEGTQVCGRLLPPVGQGLGGWGGGGGENARHAVPAAAAAAVIVSRPLVSCISDSGHCRQSEKPLK